MKRLIAPSLLACDFGNLQKDICMVNESEADYIHCDIMDGVFVPNISFGFPVLEYVKKYAEKPLDVHLMIVNPENYLQRYKEAGADILTVHWEACTHLHRVIEEIKNLGMKAGISLNPHTPVDLLTDILQDIDLVLIMSVNPGYGGQKYIERSYSKISRLRQMCNEAKPDVLIEVDGGVDLTNAGKLFNAGVNILVAGTTVFRADNPKKMISDLKKAT
ncbi:MAG: ribulose-phosphate 3-epimerase [Bacteroidales bacterium]|nr:ribulose-phosphate 3-epimerase [Bacteroidales bacterium]